MTLVQKFKEKYGVNPIQLVAEAHLKNLGLAKAFLNRLEKSQRLKRLLENYIDDKNLKIEVNNEFLKDLVESFAEAKEKFPENVKASVDTGTKFEVPNQMSGIPKSKGTLENFKDIVGTDELRPIMMGVYVSEDGFIVGTDAHKLVKQKNNGLLSQTDYAGKTIDLTKYIKSKGKLIDFVDGVYPKYDAVIPRDTPYEDRALSTYAFYNYVKSAIDVKRLGDAEIFSINFNLMTETSGETKMFSFAYHVLFDALNFAMLNGWDFFTLRYSEPNRAVVFDFDGDNIVLVMPTLIRYGSVESGGSTGTIPLTPEEVEEKYRLGLTNQKATKPKASKPVRPSAPVSSEPFKKFEGELSDTTYIHRSKIDSIKLVSGEVIGKNDVIDGFYRVNKKMAHGGGIERSGSRKLSFKDWMESKGITVYKRTYYWVADDNGDDYMYVGDNKTEVLNFLKEEWNREFESNNSKMAHGGMIQHGLNENDEIIKHFDNVVVVKNRTKNSSNADQIFVVNLNTGQRWTENEWYQKKPREVGKLSKMARGGSMYAGGGNMFEKPIAMYREVSGKTRNLPQSTEVYESEINRFIDYVHDFYEEEGYSKAEVKSAVNKYLADLGNQDTYGGGDSIDREKVYKYLEKDSLEKSYKSGLITQGEYEQLKRQKETKYATGGSMYADGGLIAYADGDMDSEIGRFSSLTEAKKFAKANKWRYNTMSFQDEKYDEILVSKDDSFKDIDWLFSGKMAHGGSTTHSHEAGDKVTFKSVMGGTKTGLIVSKLGEDGFRIKTEDGFATVKKSAIV